MAYSLADREKTEQALHLAGHLHERDERQRGPYINHPLRVALRIICHYAVRDADITCAGLLHDAVEDHADDLAANGGRLPTDVRPRILQTGGSH